DVELAFTGVTADELAASEAEQQILTDALALFDEHVLPEDVSVKSFSDATNPSVTSHLRNLQASSTEVTFEIKAYLSAFGYTELTEENYNAAFDVLSQSMETF